VSDEFEPRELGWKIERIAAGEYRGQIESVVRRVTPAMAKRWPALKLGRWIIIDIDPYTGASLAQTWPHEPGRPTTGKELRPRVVFVPLGGDGLRPGLGEAAGLAGRDQQAQPEPAVPVPVPTGTLTVRRWRRGERSDFFREGS